MLHILSIPWCALVAKSSFFEDREWEAERPMLELELSKVLYCWSSAFLPLLVPIELPLWTPLLLSLLAPLLSERRLLLQRDRKPQLAHCNPAHTRVLEFGEEVRQQAVTRLTPRPFSRTKKTGCSTSVTLWRPLKQDYATIMKWLWLSLACYYTLSTSICSTKQLHYNHVNRTDIYFAAFFPMTPAHSREGLIGHGVMPAVRLAIKHINQSPNILKGYKLHMYWNDTQVRWMAFGLFRVVL